MTRHERQKTVNELERIDILDYVDNFLAYLKRIDAQTIDTRQYGAIDYMIGLINTPEYTRFKSMRGLDGKYFWDKQNVTYVRSNLGSGRGYVFYFLCNDCGRRVKYLYKENEIRSPLCRICSNLVYPVPPRTRQFRDLSRLIRKPYLSGEAKYMLIKRAGITKADIPDELDRKEENRS